MLSTKVCTACKPIDTLTTSGVCLALASWTDLKPNTLCVGLGIWRWGSLINLDIKCV